MTTMSTGKNTSASTIPVSVVSTSGAPIPTADLNKNTALGPPVVHCARPGIVPVSITKSPKELVKEKVLNWISKHSNEAAAVASPHVFPHVNFIPVGAMGAMPHLGNIPIPANYRYIMGTNALPLTFQHCPGENVTALQGLSSPYVRSDPKWLTLHNHSSDNTNGPSCTGSAEATQGAIHTMQRSVTRPSDGDFDQSASSQVQKKVTFESPQEKLHEPETTVSCNRQVTDVLTADIMNGYPLTSVPKPEALSLPSRMSSPNMNRIKSKGTPVSEICKDAQKMTSAEPLGKNEGKHLPAEQKTIIPSVVQEMQETSNKSQKIAAENNNRDKSTLKCSVCSPGKASQIPTFIRGEILEINKLSEVTSNKKTSDRRGKPHVQSVKSPKEETEVASSCQKVKNVTMPQLPKNAPTVARVAVTTVGEAVAAKEPVTGRAANHLGRSLPSTVSAPKVSLASKTTPVPSTRKANTTSRAKSFKTAALHEMISYRPFGTPVSPEQAAVVPCLTHVSVSNQPVPQVTSINPVSSSSTKSLCVTASADMPSDKLQKKLPANIPKLSSQRDAIMTKATTSTFNQQVTSVSKPLPAATPPASITTLERGNVTSTTVTTNVTSTNGQADMARKLPLPSVATRQQASSAVVLTPPTSGNMQVPIIPNSTVCVSQPSVVSKSLANEVKGTRADQPADSMKKVGPLYLPNSASCSPSRMPVPRPSCHTTMPPMPVYSRIDKKVRVPERSPSLRHHTGHIEGSTVNQKDKKKPGTQMDHKITEKQFETITVRGHDGRIVKALVEVNPIRLHPSGNLLSFPTASDPIQNKNTCNLKAADSESFNLPNTLKELTAGKTTNNGKGTRHILPAHSKQYAESVLYNIENDQNKVEIGTKKGSQLTRVHSSEQKGDENGWYGKHEEDAEILEVLDLSLPKLTGREKKEEQLSCENQKSKSNILCQATNSVLQANICTEKLVLSQKCTKTDNTHSDPNTRTAVENLKSPATVAVPCRDPASEIVQTVAGNGAGNIPVTLIENKKIKEVDSHTVKLNDFLKTHGLISKTDHVISVNISDKVSEETKTEKIGNALSTVNENFQKGKRKIVNSSPVHAKKACTTDGSMCASVDNFGSLISKSARSDVISSEEPHGRTTSIDNSNTSNVKENTKIPISKSIPEKVVNTMSSTKGNNESTKEEITCLDFAKEALSENKKTCIQQNQSEATVTRESHWKSGLDMLSSIATAHLRGEGLTKETSRHVANSDPIFVNGLADYAKNGENVDTVNEKKVKSKQTLEKESVENTNVQTKSIGTQYQSDHTRKFEHCAVTSSIEYQQPVANENSKSSNLASPSLTSVPVSANGSLGGSFTTDIRKSNQGDYINLSSTADKIAQQETILKPQNISLTAEITTKLNDEDSNLNNDRQTNASDVRSDGCFDSNQNLTTAKPCNDVSVNIAKESRQSTNTLNHVELLSKPRIQEVLLPKHNEDISVKIQNQVAVLADSAPEGHQDQKSQIDKEKDLNDRKFRSNNGKDADQHDQGRTDPVIHSNKATGMDSASEEKKSKTKLGKMSTSVSHKMKRQKKRTVNNHKATSNNNRKYDNLMSDIQKHRRKSALFKKKFPKLANMYDIVKSRSARFHKTAMKKEKIRRRSRKRSFVEIYHSGKEFKKDICQGFVCLADRVKLRRRAKDADEYLFSSKADKVRVKMEKFKTRKLMKICKEFSVSLYRMNGQYDCRGSCNVIKESNIGVASQEDKAISGETGKQLGTGSVNRDVTPRDVSKQQPLPLLGEDCVETQYALQNYDMLNLATGVSTGIKNRYRERVSNFGMLENFIRETCPSFTVDETETEGQTDEIHQEVSDKPLSSQLPRTIMEDHFQDAQGRGNVTSIKGDEQCLPMHANNLKVHYELQKPTETLSFTHPYEQHMPYKLGDPTEKDTASHLKICDVRSLSDENSTDIYSSDDYRSENSNIRGSSKGNRKKDILDRTSIKDVSGLLSKTSFQINASAAPYQKGSDYGYSHAVASSEEKSESDSSSESEDSGDTHPFLNTRGKAKEALGPAKRTRSQGSFTLTTNTSPICRRADSESKPGLRHDSKRRKRYSFYSRGVYSNRNFLHSPLRRQLHLSTVHKVLQFREDKVSGFKYAWECRRARKRSRFSTAYQKAVKLSRLRKKSQVEWLKHVQDNKICTVEWESDSGSSDTPHPTQQQNSLDDEQEREQHNESCSSNGNEAYLQIRLERCDNVG